MILEVVEKQFIHLSFIFLHFYKGLLELVERLSYTCFKMLELLTVYLSASISFGLEF